MRIFRLSLCLTLAAGASGCSLRRLVARSAGDLMPRGSAAFYDESDPQFAEQSMAGQLKLMEILLKNDPKNRTLLLYAAQGFGGYAYLFLEDKEPERAKNFYVRARDYGLRALNCRYRLNLLTEPSLDQVDQALQKLKRKDVPLLFWTAYGWGGQANLDRQSPESLAALPKIEKMMLRVNELDPGYFYGGAALFLGSYYGSKPKIFGGDLKKSKAFFDQAVAASQGRFLTAIELCARYYAIPAQDKDLFKERLQKVLDFDLASFPEQRLANAVAQRRAKKLMEEADEHF